MKKAILLISVAFCVLLIGCRPAVHVVQGDPAVMKGEETIEIRFTYDNMYVGDLTEEEYIKDRKERAEDEESAEQWHANWLNDRTERFEPRFIELLNRYTEDQGLVFEEGWDDTRYIMVVNTYYTEPGFYHYRSRPAEIRLNITLFKRAEPENPVVEFDIPTVEGLATPDTGTRLHTAYGTAARLFGRYLNRNL